MVQKITNKLGGKIASKFLEMFKARHEVYLTPWANYFGLSSHEIKSSF